MNISKLKLEIDDFVKEEITTYSSRFELKEINRINNSLTLLKETASKEIIKLIEESEERVLSQIFEIFKITLNLLEKKNILFTKDEKELIIKPLLMTNKEFNKEVKRGIKDLLLPAQITKLRKAGIKIDDALKQVDEEKDRQLKMIEGVI